MTVLAPEKVSIRATNVFRKENSSWKMIVRLVGYVTSSSMLGQGV